MQSWGSRILAIEIQSLSKRFGQDGYSLDNVGFAVPSGEVFGFLGPNGSGKTTMVRILNGILRPTSGEARIFGRPVAGNENAIHRMSGVVTELAGLYDSLTAKQNLEIFGGLFEIPQTDLGKRISKLLSMFDLSRVDGRGKKVGTFSTGMKKSLSIARALLHKPKLLFLDEPTNGLDPEAAENVIRFIRALVADENITVFLCTHQLKYAEEICTRYGFISKGKMLGTGTLAELAARKGAVSRLMIRGTNLTREAGAEWEDGRLSLPVADDASAAAALRRLIGAGAEIYDASQINWSLERLYFEYQKEAKDAAGH